MSTHTLDLSSTDGSVERRINEVRQGNRQSLGDLLQLYQNYLSLLAQALLDRRPRDCVLHFIQRWRGHLS